MRKRVRQPETEDVVPSANVSIVEFCANYMENFSRLFIVEESTGEISSNEAHRRDIIQWFNENHVFISLVSGIPLEPISLYVTDTATMMHVYSVAQVTRDRIRTLSMLRRRRI